MESLDWKKILFVILGNYFISAGIPLEMVVGYNIFPDHMLRSQTCYLFLTFYPVCFYCNTRPCFNIPIKRDSCHAFFVLSYSLTFL